MIFDESAIKIVLSYTPGEKRYGDVKLMPSGTGRGSSFHCPRTDASNVEQVCDEVVDAIIRAATNPTTAESDKFKFMLLVLEHQARVTWQQACTKCGVDTANPATGDYLLVVKEFFNKCTHTTKMRDNILRYLEMGVKKPRDKDPIKYESRFMQILKNAEYFNGIKPAPSDEELKDWYLRSYPKAYKADYMKKGTFSQDDIPDITKHMSYLHTIDEANGKLKESSSKSSKDKSSKKYRKEHKSSRRDRRYKGDRDEDRSSKPKYSSSRKTKAAEVSDDAPCVVHPNGKHTWGECSLNPANKRDDDERKRNRSDRKREEKKSYGKKPSHSHHVSHRSDDDESSHSRSSGEASSSGSSSGSDSDSSSEERGSKRRATSHHNNAAKLEADVKQLQIVNGFDDE